MGREQEGELGDEEDEGRRGEAPLLLLTSA